MSSDAEWEHFLHPDAAPSTFPDDVTWGPRDLFLGAAIVFLLFAVVVIVIAGPVVAIAGEDAPETLFATAIAQIIWYGASVLALHWVVGRKGGHWHTLGLRPPAFKPGNVFDVVVGWLKVVPRWLAVPIVGWSAAITSVIVYGIIATATGSDVLIPNEQVPSDAFDNTFVLAALGIAIVIGAPIAEEIMFRGFLFGGLHSRMGFLPAALISGLLFSAAHTDPGLIIPFTLVGMVLAYTYEYTGTLYGSMSVHFTFNAVSYCLLIATH